MKNRLSQLNINRKSICALIALLLILAVVLGYCYTKTIKNTFITGAPYPTQDTSVELLEQDEEIVQRFSADAINMFSLDFETPNNGAFGHASVVLRNVEDKREIYASDIDFSQIDFSDDVKFRLDAPIQTEEPEAYELVISADQLDADYDVYINIIASEIRNASLTINDNPMESNLNFAVYGSSGFTKDLFVLLAIFSLMLMLVAFYLLILKPVRIEKTYLVMVLLIGMLYIFVFPPNSAPDELTHYTNAYQVANSIVGAEKNDDNTMSFRQTDYKCFSYSNMPTGQTYSEYSDGLLHPSAGKDGRKQVMGPKISAPVVPYVYAPQTIGNLVARLFRLDFEWSYMLGRLFNLILFAVITYLAICRTPIGKGVFAIVALFPMTMELAASQSYDPFVIAFSFLALSQYLYMAYGENKTRKRDFVVLIGAIIILAPVKGIYLTLLLLPFFLPQKCFSDKRQRKAYLLILAGCVLVAIVIVLFIFFNMIDATQNTAIVRDDGALFTFADFLANPLLFIKMFVKSSLVGLQDLILTMVGSNLGWLEIMIKPQIILCYVLILAFAALRRRDEEIIIKTTDRVLFIVAFAGAFVLMMFVFFVSWTPVSSEIIQGQQGRYLIPLIPLIALLLNGNELTRNRISDRHLFLACCLLQCITIPMIFREIIFR
ncbi:MAG: DUF2142 domain-containing protein [Clostridiales Family XIII bacterium]|nr:DUF2142 domain-containing protein [Clostridiales Family XIII bacterium]